MEEFPDTIIELNQMLVNSDKLSLERASQVKETSKDFVDSVIEIDDQNSTDGDDEEDGNDADGAPSKKRQRLSPQNYVPCNAIVAEVKLRSALSVKLYATDKRTNWRGGRFVDQEQWERWRTKRKLVSGSKHRGRFRGRPPRKNFEIVNAKSCNLVHFWPIKGLYCRP